MQFCSSRVFSSVGLLLAVALLALPVGLLANPGGSWNFNEGTLGQPIEAALDSTVAGNSLVRFTGSDDEDPRDPPVYGEGITGAAGDLSASFSGAQVLELINGDELFDFRTPNTMTMWVNIPEGEGGELWSMHTNPSIRAEEETPHGAMRSNFIENGDDTTVPAGDNNGAWGTEWSGGRCPDSFIGNDKETGQVNDGTWHHLAHVFDPQREIITQVPFDCNGDSVIDALDVDINGDPCTQDEISFEDVYAKYIDGVLICQSDSRRADSGLPTSERWGIDARRTKSYGDFRVGYGAEGVLNPQDCSGPDGTPDGIIDELDVDDNGDPCMIRNGMQPAFGSSVKSVGLTGLIDEFKIFQGALSQDQITAIAEQDTIDCSSSGDTSVTGMTITPSSDGQSGIYTFEATGATDTSGDDILYTWVARRTNNDTDPLSVDSLNYILQNGPSVDFATTGMFLPAGDYIMELTVDDNVLCEEVSGSQTVSSAPFTVLPLAGFAGFRAGTSAGGGHIIYEMSQWASQDPGIASGAPDEDRTMLWETVTGSQTAFGEDFTFRVSGHGGRLEFLFDISVPEAGPGEAGEWFNWTRLINPGNQSDYTVMEGDADDILNLNISPEGPPWPCWCPTSPTSRFHPLGENGMNSGDDRIFEFNAGPFYEWIGHLKTPAGDPVRGGHVKDLRDGINRQFMFTRQGGPLQQVDLMLWTSDIDLVGSDQIVKDSADIAPPTGIFLSRGDANNDSNVNIADPSYIANFVFGIPPASVPPCEDGADGNGDGAINIADVSFVANFVFGVPPSTTPPAPGPNCGIIDTADLTMSCDTPSPQCGN